MVSYVSSHRWRLRDLATAKPYNKLSWRTTLPLTRNPFTTIPW